MLWVLPALDSQQQTWLDTPEYITDVMGEYLANGNS